LPFRYEPRPLAEIIAWRRHPQARPHGAIAKEVRKQPVKRRVWNGTVDDLLDIVGPTTKIKSTKKLSVDLRRLGPMLRSIGIQIVLNSARPSGGPSASNVLDMSDTRISCHSRHSRHWRRLRLVDNFRRPAMLPAEVGAEQCLFRKWESWQPVHPLSCHQP
jgi:hypothetical protein